ncbi:sugar ABC transporter ATP-binding protein [Nakamurella deserti]|uniref:sugar ABC transporter ATP-binding protein n=1 Tax=Nakamurella deserti TaxID=2164074 RepID=UPI000DBE3C73|nr:sugar ABC transporter ATP-binding protein [Nakamurella deserti]
MSHEHGSVALRADGVGKSFGPVHALAGVDFELRRGEVTALMGENGAGKSTLLKILTGDHQPDRGRLLLDGAEVSFADPSTSRRAGVRVIAQEPEIVPHVTVAENIYVGALPTGGGVFRARNLLATATRDLERFGFAGVIDARTLGRRLSPAQRQIAEIMRALVGGPDVLCFDEPTSSLGDEEVDILFALIRRLRDEGKAIGYVSHRMKEIFQLADRVTVLRDGKLVGTTPAAETDEAQLVRMMVGRDLSQLFDRTPTTRDEVVLQLTAVTTDDVTDIDLTVHAGEVVGVAGLIGAGRSELMHAIVGDVPLSSGTLTLHGVPQRFSSPGDSVRAGIGFAPEERKADALIMQRTVRDNVSLAVLGRLSRFGFVRRRDESDTARRYVDRLRVRTPSIEQLVKNLSGGNQQKVVLARWLARNPALLILDEPTRGVDVGAKAEIYAIIQDLAAEGMAVLVVSSEMPEVIGLADRIYVMAGGRISGELAATEATEERILALAMAERTAVTAHAQREELR